MTQAEDAYQGMRGTAGRSLDASEAGIQSAIQRGKMFGASGLEDVSAAEAAAQAANENRRLGRDEGVLNFDANFADSDRNYLAGLNNAELAERGIDYGAAGDILSARNQANPRRNWLGEVAGAAAPFVAGMFGGGGGGNDSQNDLYNLTEQNGRSRYGNLT
jgi:hypothetical protein